VATIDAEGAQIYERTPIAVAMRARPSAAVLFAWRKAASTVETVGAIEAA
jgi:hypothetical protein